jgi:hypothetical protein
MRDPQKDDDYAMECAERIWARCVRQALPSVQSFHLEIRPSGKRRILPYDYKRGGAVNPIAIVRVFKRNMSIMANFWIAIAMSNGYEYVSWRFRRNGPIVGHWGLDDIRREDAQMEA